MTVIEKENARLRDENFELKQENAQLKKLLFGSKREGFKGVDNPQQTSLFDEEAASEQVEEQLEVKVKKSKSVKKRAGIKRNEFPASIRRQEIRLEPTKDISDLTKIGEDITELLGYKPAELFVKKIVRPRYVNKQDEDQGVFQASIPPRTVPKGIVDDSLIVQLIVEKILFHTPIYRFVKKLKQAGIDGIRQNNLHNWFHAGAQSLVPLYHLLVEDILATRYIQADETPITVLAKNKINASHRGYMWAFHAPELRAVAFNYEPSRSTQAAKQVLDQFSGTLQVDGYTAYEKIGQRSDIQLTYCMAHARRKFFDAQQTDPSRATYFLENIQQLYEIERQARDLNLDAEKRRSLRQDQAIPILKKLEAWLVEQHSDRTLVPKSPIRKAIDYALSRWKGLSAYAQNGRLEIDNNLIENTIRPIALGRKNYLFAGSHDAAQNLAVLYSIVGTCEKNNINVAHYLNWVLHKIANHKVTPQAKLWLPHRIDPKILSQFIS